MLSSMTGFGRVEKEIGNKSISVEIKSVNHRFFECSIRTPRGMSYLEEPVKSRISSRIKRGKIEVYINLDNRFDEPVSISYNSLYLSGWINALREIAKEHKLKDDLKLSHIAAMRDIFTAKKAEEDQEQLASDIMGVLDEALDTYASSRMTEGQRLAQDIRTRLAAISGHVRIIDECSPKTVAEYRARLLAKITETLADTNIDESRILTEAAIFADRVSVAEETTRLKTHIDNFSALLDGDSPIGKKLDFYMQEMNREINTIGSKCNDIDISKIVIEVKSELENIREQIQNIE